MKYFQNSRSHCDVLNDATAVDVKMQDFFQGVLMEGEPLTGSHCLFFLESDSLW